MSTKILLGIPCNRQLRPYAVNCLLNLAKDQNIQKVIFATEGYTISENRNYIVAQAKKEKVDYVLMIDDDMTFPPDLITRLLGRNKDIIGVLSHSRKLPLKPTVEPIEEIKPDLFQCKTIGGGVMLINMKVFEKIDKPYFDTETYDYGLTKVGEDSWFCHQATKRGYEIWCDPTLKIGHLGDYEY